MTLRGIRGATCLAANDAAEMREAVLSALMDLPQATIATEEEVFRFIEANGLPGSGIGYVDAHLLAATRLTPGAALWTRDKRLTEVSERLGLAAHPA